MNFPSQNCTVLKTYTFNSPYVLKTKSVKHCYIAITAISMFEVTLARLKSPFL